MYSQIKSVEVWNFMSIEHGKVEFDETNIINLKGYNDSGKSALLTAVKVCMYNSNPTKQAGFIQDDKDYFRVLLTFDDGVQIMRDKYAAGQSLYEMYKNGQLLYTTKVGNALSRISDVPQPIADYLGLIMYDGVCLNARACFEKQLGVQTTGSENSKMFNAVLKSEEIATASTLLNSDRNKLAGDINAVEYELSALTGVLGNRAELTDLTVERLRALDASIDSLSKQEAVASGASAVAQAMSDIRISPELKEISGVGDLLNIKSLVDCMSGISVAPEVPDICSVSELERISMLMEELSALSVAPEVNEIGSVDELVRLMSLMEELSGVSVQPKVKEISLERSEALLALHQMVLQLSRCSESIVCLDSKLTEVNEALSQAQKEAEFHGKRFTKCPNCGQVFAVGEECIC